MTERNPLRVMQNVLHDVRNSEEAKHKKVTGAGLDPALARVREFQSKRIAQTYRDFAAQPQYAPLMKFFLEDLYAARDFTQRDHDVERAHNFLSKLVPAEMLTLTTDSIELTQLSRTLDERLLEVLTHELNAPKKLTPQIYAEAYRRSDRYPDRERQIDLLVKVMGDAAQTAHLRISGPALLMVKGPAKAAGWDELFGFLERGHHAFAKVKKPEVFLEAIEERETKIMARIQRGDKNPFGD